MSWRLAGCCITCRSRRYTAKCTPVGPLSRSVPSPQASIPYAGWPARGQKLLCGLPALGQLCDADRKRNEKNSTRLHAYGVLNCRIHGMFIACRMLEFTPYIYFVCTHSVLLGVEQVILTLRNPTANSLAAPMPGWLTIVQCDVADSMG